MTTSTVVWIPLSLVIALGGVACSPVVAGSIADPPAGTGAATGGGEPASAGPIVEIIVFNGSGCRDAGSASVTAAPEGGAFTVAYTSMGLTQPPGATSQHLNCAVGLTVSRRPGRRLTVTGTTEQGVAHLPAGASGKLTSSFFFAGTPLSVDERSTLAGAHDGAFNLTESVAPGESIASTCGEDLILTINTSLDLSALPGAGPSASMEVSRLDVAFRWDEC